MFQTVAFPEAEYQASRGDYEGVRRALKAIGEGRKKRDYSKIRASVLSMFATFRPVGDPLGYEIPKDPQQRAVVEAFEAATMVYIKKYKKSLFTAVPGTRRRVAGRKPLYLSLNEADVLREIRAFVTHLPFRN